MPTTIQSHAVLVDAGPATVLVTSDAPAVTDWITQYFGCWWTVRPTNPQVETRSPELYCQINADRFAAAQDSVNTRSHHIIEFARKPLYVADNTDNTVCAVDPLRRSLMPVAASSSPRFHRRGETCPGVVVVTGVDATPSAIVYSSASAELSSA